MKALLAALISVALALWDSCDGRPPVRVSQECLDAPLAPGCMP